MGIPKLTSFVNNFFTGWKEEKLGKYLVIDGPSLCYHLYKFKWIKGGQYTDYYFAIVKFFGALRSSAVESVVVIDGYDYPEEKSDTVKKRNDASARKVCNHFLDSKHNPNVSVSLARTDVLPPLAATVFQDVLCELNVTCIMVDGEADKHITQLANFYSCPVLSNDSDFFMFSLKGGFIPLTMLNWRRHPVTAKVYHVDAFLGQFNLGHESLRLIIPAICGNDFLSAVMGWHKSFFKHIKQVTICAMGVHHPVKSVVTYASHYDNMEDFVARIKSGCTEYLNEGGKDHLIDNCMKAALQYDIEEVVSLEHLRSETRLTLVSEHPLPDWLLRQIRGCKYPVSLLLLICEGGIEDPVPVGDPSKESCHYISLPLHQAIYSLLELHPLIVEGMFDRFEMVDAVVYTQTIICEGEVVTLDLLPDLKLRTRKKIIYYFLHSNADLVELLEEKWRLVIASVIYWTRAANVPIFIVKILILTFVLCSRSTTDSVDQYPELLHIRIRHLQRFLGTQTWWEGLHCFTQWQLSYEDACNLNLILQLPLQIYSVAHLFNSKMAMYFLSTNDVLVMVSKLSSDDRELYDQLLTTVLSHKMELYEVYTSISVCDRESETVMYFKTPKDPTCAISLFSHRII